MVHEVKVHEDRFMSKVHEGKVYEVKVMRVGSWCGS